MKAKITLFVLLILVFAACSPTATATEDSATQPPEATEPSAATEPPAVETSTLAPTQAPSLQIGDEHYYLDGTTLVAVPAGDFSMGGNGSDNPEHNVNVRDYWIYSTRVTNQQYAVCVQLGKCTTPDPTDNPGYGNVQNANDPVTGVTYEQASNYCSFVGGRLPTEAEWEKAAGSTLDKLGNVFEWISDWYDPDYYQNSPSDDPSGPENGTAHVVRSNSDSITNRDSEDPQTHRSDLGFRCVIDQPAQLAPLCESPQVFGGAATSTCPPLELTQVELCAQNFPYTNVTVKGATDPTIQAQGCVVTDDPATVSCQPPNNLVSAQVNCQVNISGDPACPIGYSLQGNTCIADGAEGSCPAGLNFDSSKQCCGLPAGAESSLQPMVCPVGTFYIASQNACLASPVQELVTVSVDVEFKSCVASAGGGGCAEPKSGCPAETDWNSDLCCCTEQMGGPLVCTNRK